MAEVTLQIGDRRHTLACRDGEEEHLQLLGDMVAARWATAQRAAGTMGAERVMLLIALMLADALHESEHRPPPDGSMTPAQLDRLASRLEAIAVALEQPALSA